MNLKTILHEQVLKGIVHDIKLHEPIMYVNNEKRMRSGHVGHALCEFEQGKIIDFNSNTSYNRLCGHSSFGWMEYRISNDFGKTFGEICEFPYSKKMFLDGYFTAIVEKAVSRKDGVITAFCTLGSMLSENAFEPHDIPKVVRSTDGGKSWGQAFDFSPYKGRIFDAVEFDGDFYVLQFCNDAKEKFWGTRDEHVYRIYKSTDNGQTFNELCVVPFKSTLGRTYGNMIITEDKQLIVYAYNVNDQEKMDYCISNDMGKTWIKTGLSYLKQKIRNPQVGCLDGQYILHGRAGEDEHGHGGFVLYTSKDGINWDDGKMLIENKSACFYSDNLTLKTPYGKNKMLVQYSENINDPGSDWSGRVNVMHLWIESL